MRLAGPFEVCRVSRQPHLPGKGWAAGSDDVVFFLLRMNTGIQESAQGALVSRN